MIIDTNIIIAYLAGEEQIVRFLSNWRMRGGFLFVPTIVETELLSFPKWNEGELKEAKVFLEDNFVTVPFDREISRLAAAIRRTTSIKVPDAVIAASALYIRAPLLTRNERDFKKVRGLELIVP